MLALCTATILGFRYIKIVTGNHRAYRPAFARPLSLGCSTSVLFNDLFLKQYVTALIKKQWGQNLLKFRGTKLAGGVELNGREIYDDGVKEIEELRQRMKEEFELPPYDFIG